MDDLKREIQAAFARQQAGLPRTHETRVRLLRDALAGARRPNRLFRLAGVTATLVVAGAITVAVLLTMDTCAKQRSCPRPSSRR